MTGRPVELQNPKVLRWRLRLLVGMLVSLVALAAAWSWSPMRAWLDVNRIVSALQYLGQSMGAVTAILGFAAALTLAVPLTFLTLVAIVAFGPVAGFVYSVTAATLGAAVSFGLGVLLGREVLQRLGGERVNLVSQSLASHGILSVVAVRMVPIAPFAVVNMVAGATHLRLHHLLIGTAIGMTPGTLGMMFFADQIIAALKTPSPLTYAIVVSMLILIGVGLWGLKRWLIKTQGTLGPSGHSEP